MIDASTPDDLSGRLLAALPGMGDPRFERSLVFLCAHSSDGAMGLIINKPAPELTFTNLLEQLEIEADEATAGPPIHFGGPMESGRGFVLHSGDYDANSSTLQVDDRFGMTATLDILEDIAQGNGPASALLALGYAGWGGGQLESEIQANGWLVCEAAPDLVFAGDSEAKWAMALRSIGVDPVLLSTNAGRA